VYDGKKMELVIIMGVSSWIWWLLLLFPAWLLLTQFRYMLLQFRSVSWPVIDATIQKGPTGRVPIGRSGTPACFLGYIFRVNGSTYTGLFALYGNTAEVEKVHKIFCDGSIRIRYNPANPRISYLNNLNDLRFARLTPTQNPQHLAQAPSFDLHDVMEN
jgi:hypothetical protein